MLRHVLGGLAVLSAQAWLGTAPALACSYGTCGGAYAAPPEGTIPANATVLVYDPGSKSWGQTPTTPALGLFTAQDRRIDVTYAPDPIGGPERLVTPAEPLTAGATYRLVNMASCPEGGGNTASWPMFNQIFTVGPASPLPTRFGVKVGLSVATKVTLAGGPACTWETTVAAAPLEIEWTAEGKAWEKLTRMTLKVDGAVWAASAYGVSVVNGWTGQRGQRSALLPFAGCDQDTTGVGLAPGTHQGELSLHVAGAQTDPPPVSFSFTLSCGTTADAGAPDGGARSDGGTPPTLADGGGCSLGRGGDAGAWLALLALTFLLARRRA